jgi:penicillin amidase
MVGSPTFPVAHNQVAAWGITVGLVDNTDLFVEEIGGDGRSVRRGDEFVPCEVRREVIRVKGGVDVVEDVLVTSHGPIVGPAFDGEVGALALRATWLEPRPIRGMLAVHRARNFQEFRSCFEHWPGIALNMVYADSSGTIGWQLVGNVPRRRRGHGMLPTPGWETDAGWEAEGVSFDDLPNLTDPACGFIATANNQPITGGDGPYLGADWIDGYRVARISEVLDSRRDWNLAHFAALQMDVASLPWRELRDSVLATPVSDGTALRARALLAAWDGQVGADSAAAAVFECFLTRMIRRIVSTRAPRSAAWALAKGFTPLTPANLLIERRVGHAVRLLREQPVGWLPKPWPEEIADGLADAIHTLETRLGPESAKWAWGALRPLTFRHPFGERRPLHRVFNLGPLPWGGDTNTVSFATTDLTDPSRNPAASASARALFDVGNWDACRFSLPGGQSGNPLSSHYDDLLPHWRAGTGVAIAWSPLAVEEATAETLELVPRSSPSPS